MTKLKILDSLEQIIKLTLDLHSILIIDKDGVKMINAGEEVRNFDSLSSCFTTSIEQAKKLGMGNQKFWSFVYEFQQIVILNLEPFAIFFVASPSANTEILYNLKERLEPILIDLKQIFHEVVPFH